MGTGVSSSISVPIVRALAIYHDSLVIAGRFEQADAGAANNIARWTGSGWAPLGSGMGQCVSVTSIVTGDVYALVPWGTSLYPSGRFNTAGDKAAFSLGRWDDGLSAIPPPVDARVGKIVAEPNPFARGVTLRYALERPASVRLVVLGADGRAVAVLAQGVQAAGPHSVSWDGREGSGRRAPGGIYAVQLQAGEARRAIRLVKID